MKRISTALLGAFMTLGGTQIASADQLEASAQASAPGATAASLLESARAASSANDDEKAGKLTEELLAHEGFSGLSPEERFEAVWIGALSAMQRRDPLEAHDYLMVLSAFEGAGADVWKYRAQAAVQIEDWEDSLFALTVVAKTWPDELGGNTYDDWAVTYTARMAQREPALRAPRHEFMNALFDGGVTHKYGLQPNDLWLELVADALERDDVSRARAIARRITGTTALVQLCVDRRFDELVAAEPSLREVRGNAVRMKQHLAKEVKRNPRALEALMYYSEALAMLGEFTEMLKVTGAAIEKVEKAPGNSPPYDDVDTHLAWAHNQKSRALSGLGRSEDAIRVLAEWQRDPRNTADKASQSINLASMLNRADRSREAMQAIDGIDWVKGLSPYGRMQLQAVRHEAYRQLGDEDQAETVLAWIREHQQESPWTAQAAFLVAGDVDSAAAMLIAGLENPESRVDVLGRLQLFERRKGKRERGEFHRRTDETWQKVLARPDVKATLENYGRIQSFSIHAGHL